MELRLLGPMEVQAGGRVLDSGRPQQQVVLAALAVDAGRLVSADALLDRISGQAPQKRASQLLYTHITRIRRMLEQATEVGGDAVRLGRRSGGYLLELAPDRVDLHRFHHLVRRAAGGDRPARDRVGLLREALDLWRGEPLAGLSGPWVETTRQVWRQQRLAAVLTWAHSALEAGEPEAVVGPVMQEVVEHPLVEPLVVVLMRALAATGRRAEALECYAVVQRRLAEELGTDPGPELRALHRAILRGEDALPDSAATSPAPAVPSPLAAVPRTVVPAQLPADVPAFTGRDRELAQLHSWFAGADAPGGAAPPASGEGGAPRAQPGRVAIGLVTGTAGVGKTALAIHWAHRAADRFPDGQLYVNLRGFDPAQPMTADAALARFLTALGVPEPEIPPELDERAARYRSELAGRRVLVVLDNAASSEQVRPLLPGTGTCAALVTSRDSLAALVAVHGARRLELDLLPAGDALRLLHHLIGPRARVDPAATATLVRRCVRLPLALRVAAELVASRPTHSLTELVDELADQQQRLNLLDAGGDPRAAVTAVFSWSVQHLPPDAARVFRLLGGHPCDDIDGYGVAALGNLDLASARRILDQLARAHLVHPSTADRYSLHDLLRAYAMRLSQEADRDHERRAAMQRLFAYYLATAATAMDRLYPAEAQHRPRPPVTVTPVPHLADAGASRRWLDRERSCLVAIARYTAAHGWPAYTTLLSATLRRYLEGGHLADALAVHSYALEAAQFAGDQAGQANARCGLGATHMWLSRLGPAAEHHQQALIRYRQIGDRLGEVQALNGLGLVQERLGHYRAAVGNHRRAVAISRRERYPLGEARSLNNLALAERRLGRYGPAAHHHEQAMAAAQRAGDWVGEAVALDNRGNVEQQLGRYATAIEYHQRALTLTQTFGHRTGEAHVLKNLGTGHLHVGDWAAANDYLERALAIFQEIGDPSGQAIALNGLGEAALAAGRCTDSLAHYTAALAIATEVGVADLQARAHAGLGHVHRALAAPETARHHYEQALTRYVDLGVPEADEVRGYLAPSIAASPEAGRRDRVGLAPGPVDPAV